MIRGSVTPPESTAGATHSRSFVTSAVMVATCTGVHFEAVVAVTRHPRKAQVKRRLASEREGRKGRRREVMLRTLAARNALRKGLDFSRAFRVRKSSP